MFWRSRQVFSAPGFPASDFRAELPEIVAVIWSEWPSAVGGP